MPAGIKDSKLWSQARLQVEAAGPQANPWPAVLSAYKAMGGDCSPEAEEACASGAMGQLLRGQESVSQSNAEKFVCLNEATVDRPRRTVRCVLITEGPGNTRTRNYYTAEFIQEAAVKYNGARAYLNHATEAEYRERSEGNIRELCGFYKNLVATQVRDRRTGQMVLAVVGDLVCDNSEAGRQALAKAEAQIEYARLFPTTTEEYCGLSICGTGKADGQVELNKQKWNRIVGVGQADSVDVVTRPARGGAFLALTESAGTLPHLPKEESTMLKTLMAILAESKAALKELADATTEEAREAAKVKIAGCEAKLAEAAKKEDDEDAKDMSALKKLMPKGSEEADDVYEARIAKVKAAARGKESQPISKADLLESISGLSADEIRTKAPKLFEAIASRVRESEAEKGEDIKALKTELREANIKLQISADKELATKLLNESGVPAKFLSVGDLLGKTEEEMKREIERTKALTEAAGARQTVVPGSAPIQQGGALDKKLSKMLEAAKN